MDKYSGRRRGFGEQMKIPLGDDYKETEEDKRATAQGVARAERRRVNESTITTEHADIDKELVVPKDTSELMVITKTKKLTAYVISATEKSPKHFRAVFVVRMQNYCLDCIEYLLEANSIRMDTAASKEKRKSCQHNAFLQLKMLSYTAFLSYENKCITKKQYEQISMMLADCINLLVAWRKSDAERKT